MTPNGQLVWAGQFVCTETAIITGVALDTNNNVFFSGSYSGTIDMNPTDGVSSMTPAGQSDGFVAKLTNAGDLVWQAHVRDTDGAETCEGVGVDSDGSVYYIGRFGNSGPIDFDPGIVLHQMTATGARSVFIVKLTNERQLVWAEQFDCHGGSIYFPVMTVNAAGNVYVGGTIKNTVDLDPGAAVFDVTCIGNQNGFLVKLNPSGEFSWAKRITGSDVAPNAIAVDSHGRIHLVATFTDLTKNVTGSPAKFTAGSRSFIAKYKPNGKRIWSGTVGGADNNEDIVSCAGLAVDSKSRIYVLGGMEHTVDVEPDDGVHEITAIGDYDGILLKLDLSPQ